MSLTNTMLTTKDLLQKSVEASTAELPSLKDLISHDLEGLGQRLEDFRELAKQADEVWITIVCCDSRVRLPEELVEVETKELNVDGTKKSKKILFVPLVTIGSGAPSEKRFRKTKEVLLEWGVAASKIRVLVTQHGDHDEINGLREGHISCGLRKVYDGFYDQFSTLSRIVSREISRLKRLKDNPEFSIDHLTLPELNKELPRSMTAINEIHQNTGIPTRLLLRAVVRNFDSDLNENLDMVVQKMRGYVFSSKNADIRQHCEVLSAIYDHQNKDLVSIESDDLLIDEIQLAGKRGIKKREDSYQDPEYVIVSFGKNVIPYPIDTLLPHLCGEGSEFYKPPADNAFRSRMITKEVPMLLGALAEAFYAVDHHNHVMHAHADKNFVSLKSVVIICENDEYYETIQKMLIDPEFIDEYKPTFAALGTPLEVINLHMDERGNPGAPTHHSLELG